MAQTQGRGLKGVRRGLILQSMPAPIGQNPSHWVEGKDPFVQWEIGTDQVGSNRSPTVLDVGV